MKGPARGGQKVNCGFYAAARRSEFLPRAAVLFSSGCDLAVRESATTGPVACRVLGGANIAAKVC